MGISIVISMPLEGEMAHHGGDVCGVCFVGKGGISILLLHTNPTWWKFFVPAVTLIVVKLLNDLLIDH